MNPFDKKTPDWLLERAAQGELDAAGVAELRARLTAEGRSLDGELLALERSNREILAAQPKQAAAAAIQRRAAADGDRVGLNRPARWRSWFGPLAAAGALALAIFFVRADPRGARRGPAAPAAEAPTVEEPTRIKGQVLRAPRLLVYRQRRGGDGAERLASGAQASRGDLLQLAYAAAEDGLYGVLLSIDGAGRVTQHLPEEGARAAPPLHSLREIRLPSAYQLDDAPDFERFVLVTASASFPVAAALDAARALAAQGPRARSLPLVLPPVFHQTSLLLDKTSKGTP